MVSRGDKRGSHVGVVISFAIFVTFIVFLYTIAQPSFKEEKREESLMVYLQKTLIENSSSRLQVMTINLEASSGTPCVQLDGFFQTFGIPNRISVWTQGGTSTQSGVSGDNLRINREDINDEFFKVHYSEKFNTVGSGNEWSCDILSEGTGYSLGVTKIEHYVFETQVSELITEYNNWYEDFKSELGISQSFEFGFGLIYENGSSIETHSVDISKNIYIREVPIKYVNANGKIENGFLKLITW